MKLTIYTVVNYDYFDFAKVFVSSLKENYPDEKLNKIIINDLGLSEEQRIKLQEVCDKVEYIKTSEEIRTESSHTEEWREVINQKTIGLEKICIEENYPILMIDSDMYVLEDFSDEILYGCDIQACKQEPEVINKEGYHIDYIGCWFVIHNEKGKTFIKKWQDLMPTIKSSHVETPALCRALKENSNDFTIKINDVRKVSSMDYNLNPKIIHFRTTGFQDLSLESRINNITNLPPRIKNKIMNKNDAAVLIDELLEKHEKNLNIVYENFRSIHNAIDIPESTSAEDCKFLQLLCLEKKPKKIIEIGTWVGSTAYSMAFATKNTETVIHTCDKVSACNLHNTASGGDMFRREDCEEADRINTNPDTWSSDFLKNKELLDGADFIFNDANISLDDCRRIYDLASDEFYFVTHDYYDHAGIYEKGFNAIQSMTSAISENNGKYELYKPEKEWYGSGYKNIINKCSALLKCTKSGKRFDFGLNWKDYVNNTLNDKIIDSHTKNLLKWFDESDIKNKKILDIGCGSGLSSLCFSLLGGEVHSFDYDKHSVEASELTKQKFNKDANWKIQQGSALDKEFMDNLGKFDIVYSWGVLHHTGKMWEAIENTISAVKENGLIMITLYKAGPNYESDLATKVKYNNASGEEKTKMINEHIKNVWGSNLNEEFLREPYDERGMSRYNDAVDWLGGYPYEVAWPQEVIDFFNARGYYLEQWEDMFEGGCVSYLFK